MATGNPVRAIARINTAANGAQIIGDPISHIGPFGFSPDGTSVLFTSEATNLVPGDTNGTIDNFLKNLATGAITRVNTTATGAQAEGDSAVWVPAAFSRDGSSVLFTSAAANLVPGDSNEGPDAFIKNLATGAITRVSTASNGDQANGGSSFVALSPDGTHALFGSVAANLVPDDTNGAWDIFLKNLATGAIARVNTNPDGDEVAARGHTGFASFSPDGTRILFDRRPQNEDLYTSNALRRIFATDLATGATTRVSAAANGDPANDHSFVIDLSPDGNTVLFISAATNLLPDDAANGGGLFLKDLTTGTVTRALTIAPPMTSFESFVPLLHKSFGFSPDGTRILFAAINADDIPGDTNGSSDYFVKDLATGTITRVNTDASGNQANGQGDPYVDWAAFSPDGTSVLFTSDATNLVPDDTNGALDLFLKNLATGAITRVNTTATGDQTSHQDFHNTFSPVFSPDGTSILFATSTPNLVPGDTNGTQDIFIKYLIPPETALAIAPAAPATARLAPTEGDTGTTEATFTVTRTGNLAATTTATWSVQGAGRFPANAADFAGNTLPAGTLAFAPDETEKTITIQIAGDTSVEGPETFAVSVIPTAPSIPAGTAEATITPDDAITDLIATAAGLALETTPDFYPGPVAGLEKQWIGNAAGNVNATVAGPNWFIRTGAGNDAIAAASGTNVLDGGAGSNVFTGGTGRDTFFLDARTFAAPDLSAPVWSTITNLGPGDAVTLWGISQDEFALAFIDGLGAPGFTGLTLHATRIGEPLPIVSLTLTGFAIADRGHTLTQSFGFDPSSGSHYLHIAHA